MRRRHQDRGDGAPEDLLEATLGPPAEPSIDWRGHIQSHPDILSGKPVVKGTRLDVAFLLSLFAAGWTQDEVLESYPTITRDGLRAMFAYASEHVADTSLRAINR